MLIFIRFVEAN